MSEMMVFSNPEFGEVRRVEIDGQYWLVGIDVARALGYSNPYNAIANHVDEDDSLKWGVVDAYGRNVQATVINESGTYSLIFSSKLPDAKKFKRWVTSEVLPTIRNKGAYSMQPLTPAQLLAAQAQVLVDMEARMNQMEAQAGALAEKVDTAIKVFSRPSEDHWKADMDKAIKELCTGNHLSVLKTKGLMYEELERAVNCDVDRRLSSLQARARKAGKRYRDAKSLTKLDAIAADKSLRAVFEGIVRGWQSRYAVTEDEAGEV